MRRWRTAILRGNADPRIRRMQTGWCDRYAQYATQRWQREANGGGDWAPLKPSTLARRKALGRTMTTILLVTRNLVAAIRRGRPGNVIAFFRPNAVRFGIGGGQRHPDTGIRKGEPAMSFGEMVVIHHAGAPSKNIPARPILVLPDRPTCDDLVRIAAVNVKQIIR